MRVRRIDALDARPPDVRWVGLLLAVSWFGEVLHNAAELPALTPLSPENSVPAAIALTLLLAWWRATTSVQQRLVRWLILLWGGVHLVGAIVTVLPLGILPFVPEQTWQHYAWHVVYAMAQVPLVLRMGRA